MNTKQVVLVTGATSGIGLAIASYLHKKGHTVYGTGRTASGISAGGFKLLSLDQLNTTTINTAIETILTSEGRIDVLVNNAGVGMAGPVESLSGKESLHIFHVNLIGLQQVCNAVLPSMRKQKRGTIINISSIAAELGLPFRAHYCSSKSATDTFSEALSMEVRGQGINVVILQPGDMKTNINESRYEVDLEPESPYYHAYKYSRALINSSVTNGDNPLKIGKLVNKIMNKKHPRFKYRQGRFLENLAVFVKNNIPYRWYEFLMMKYYKL